MPDKGRSRNTKTLAQRIDRAYLKRLFPIPLWRRIITGALLAVALLWVGIYAVSGNPAIYTSGPLTPAHAFLGRNCQSCHNPQGSIGRRVTDRQCAGCHAAPAHNEMQVSRPACMECHAEHHGTAQLGEGVDANCTSCHKNLHTRSGSVSIASSVTSFRNHPEFRAVRDRVGTPGLKFNHQKHAGELEQTCDACHQPAPLKQPHSRASDRALMSMPTYAATCAPCHALTIDDSIPTPAPHDTPAVVHDAVVAELTKHIAANPKELGRDGSPATAAAWVKFKTEADERVLWETTCARCHRMRAGGASGLPEVAPAKIAARWMPRTVFDHGAHQELTCESCHARAKKSTTSAETLMPSIAVCQRCHSQGTASAGANCSACHVYHDWSKEKGIDGKFPIERIGK